MRENISRRSFVRSAAAAIGTGAILGSSTSASAYKTASSFSHGGDGWSVSGDLSKYTNDAQRGSLLENVVAYDAGKLRVADLHVMLWDGAVVRNARDDATASSVSADGVGGRVENTIPLSDGDAYLSQDVVVASDRPALVVRNDAWFPASGPNTLFTVANPNIGGKYRDDGHGDDGWKATRNGYDALVATTTDGDWFVAFAQRRAATGQTRFDGQRIGHEANARDWSDYEGAWHDIYEERDGWIDSNTTQKSADIDLGFGLSASYEQDVTWETGLGFGTTEEGALRNVTAALDSGYQTLRDSHY